MPSVRSRLVVAVEVLEVAQPGQRGRLVDHRRWLGGGDRRVDGRGVQRVEDDRVGAEGVQRPALAGEWQLAVTSCPRARSWGTSRVPIAPLAPMTRTRMS